MPTQSKKKSVVIHTVSPVASPLPAPVATPPTATSTPATLGPTSPPDVTIPAPPLGFVPVNLADYRGSHPRAGQVTALPGVIAELNGSTSYAAVFGPAVPEASTLATGLTIASQWTAMRVNLEAFLVYVKSFEAITWKSSLGDLDKLEAIFQVVARQNPPLVVSFPELTKFFDVQKVIGQKAAASRARGVKAEIKALKATSSAQPTSATSPVTIAATPAAVVPGSATGVGGGGAH